MATTILDGLTPEPSRPDDEELMHLAREATQQVGVLARMLGREVDSDLFDVLVRTSTIRASELVDALDEVLQHARARTPDDTFGLRPPGELRLTITGSADPAA